MNRIIQIFLITVLIFFVACGDSYIKKPKGLLSEKKMVEILIDLHITNTISVEANIKLGKELKSEDYYYSVLKKYDVADTVFEQSIIYYTSFPKDFEKIYAEVLDRVNQMRDSYSQREIQPLNLGEE